MKAYAYAAPMSEMAAKLLRDPEIALEIVRRIATGGAAPSFEIQSGEDVFEVSISASPTIVVHETKAA